MTQRQWGPTGVVIPQPATLTSEQKESIATALRAHGVSAHDQFYLALESALGRYYGMQQIHDSTRKPGSIRKDLNSARKALDRFEA